MFFGYGAAQYAHMAALVLAGAMLLLLATKEKGPKYTKQRTQLLALFFLLVIANLRLPFLDFLELPAISFLAAMYGKKGDEKLVFALVFAELFLATVRTLSTGQLLGANALAFTGAALMITCTLRFFVLFRLYAFFKKPC